VLRRNPPKVRVTSGLKLFTEIIGNFCATLLNIFSKEIISNNTNVENKFWSNIWNTWKYQWNETDDEILPVFYLTIPLNFEIYLLEFPWESVFGIIADNVLYL